MAGARMTSEQYALLHAVEDVDAKKVKEILAKGGVDLDDIVSENGAGIVQAAVECEYGDPVILKALLEAGANPNARGFMDTTALHVSAQQGDSVKLLPLARAGADINAQDRGGETPLHKCTGANRKEYAFQLLELGADSRLLDNTGAPAHEMKRQALDEEFVSRLRDNLVPPLLDRGADVTRDVLFAKADNGLCALDAGMTWLSAERWLPELARRDEVPSKDSLMQTGKDGKSYLQRAVEFRAGEAVLNHLAEQGEYLQPQELLEGGKPTALLKALVEKQLTPMLFKEEAWKGHHATEMQQLYRALPSEAQATVTNYHVLRTHMAQDHSQQREQNGYGR